jgi:hypothetical protein
MRFKQFPETQRQFGPVTDTGKFIKPANGTITVILASTATVVVRQIQFDGTCPLSAEATIALTLPYGLIGLRSSFAPCAAWTRQQRQAPGARNPPRLGDRIVLNARFRLNTSSSCS